MKYLPYPIAFFAGFLIAGFVNHVAVAQAANPAVGATSKVQWDPVTKDATGAAETVIGYRVAVSAAAADLNAAGAVPLATAPVPAGATELTLGPILSGQTGNLRLWVQAQDAAGNLSKWGGPLLVTADTVPPTAPVNLKVSVTVTIGG